ncbi:hypothetical protein FTO60_06950 [Octadecabacter sp. SW4]|uniref:hypothetical protein n=1 Tax=Octadecabacter sp. SW4 TaxID=2602067 RepID=UPI0011C1D325|nr:hypothetical protein [Octadecabacter sp. SW4]QEE35465.1 hypothetical protein FTO60_06950 [Octadecabacter sp. SW4]
MSFALVARIVAAICAVLFVILLLFPATYAPTYGVAADMGVQFITRRAAPMFIAPAVILWCAASAPDTPLRRAVALGIALSFVGIAATGLAAYLAGTASAAILIAALGECLMAAALWATRKN